MFFKEVYFLRKFILFLICSVFSYSVFCSDSQNQESKKILKGIDSLGGNQDLYKNLKKLYSKDKGIYVVQKRNNPRIKAFELGFSSEYGESTYLQHLVFGIYSHYHLNPYWSFFVNLKPYTNHLSPEGEYSLNEALSLWDKGEDLNFIPELNWPVWSSSLGLSFYPFYGKMSLFKSYVIYFDHYISLGLGFADLRKKGALNYSFETGFSFWISRYLSLRSFLNWQFHKEVSLNEPTDDSSPHQKKNQWINQLYFGISLGIFI